MIIKGTTRYPGIKTINAVKASVFTSYSQFDPTNRIDVTMDTSMLEINSGEDDSGNAIEEHILTGKVAGISPGIAKSIEKRFILKVTFYYSEDVMYIGSRDFPAILNIKETTGQTGGNFVGSDITFNCQYPSVRKNEE